MIVLRELWWLASVGTLVHQTLLLEVLGLLLELVRELVGHPYELGIRRQALVEGRVSILKFRLLLGIKVSVLVDHDLILVLACNVSRSWPHAEALVLTHSHDLVALRLDQVVQVSLYRRIDDLGDLLAALLVLPRHLLHEHSQLTLDGLQLLDL